MFDKACTALRNWETFKLGWVQLYPRDAPIKIDVTVGVLIRHFGFYSLNAARIVYVIEDEPFGFAYGTLADHAEQGEERFSIESTDDDSGWYDILAWPRCLSEPFGNGRVLAVLCSGTPELRMSENFYDTRLYVH